MTSLRERMCEDMRQHNFSAGMQTSYLYHITEFARYFRLPPDRLGLNEIRAYQLYLIDQRQLLPAAWSGDATAASARRGVVDSPFRTAPPASNPHNPASVHGV